MTPLRKVTFSVGLATGLVLSGASAVIAICGGEIEAALPQRVTFNGGEVVDILARDSLGLRYRISRPGQTESTEVLIQAGIFILEVRKNEETISFEWTSELPRIEDLEVGAEFVATARRKTANGDESDFETRAQVTGVSTVELSGCDYPVLVIEIQNTHNGKDAGKVTKFLHIFSQIPLKNLVIEGSKTTENLVVEIR